MITNKAVGEAGPTPIADELMAKYNTAQLTTEIYLLFGKAVNTVSQLEQQLSARDAEISRLRGIITQGLESLNALIDEHSDPGSAALSAQYMMRQESLSPQSQPSTVMEGDPGSHHTKLEGGGV